MIRAGIASVAVGLLAAVTVARAAQEPRLSPAIAWRDCAPWDGPAFTVAVGREGATSVDPARPWLRISIWQEAGTRHGVTYRFPDTTQKLGAVEYGGTAFPSVNGTVTFPSAVSEEVVAGSFDFMTPDGRHLAGRFRGGWRPVAALCGT